MAILIKTKLALIVIFFSALTDLFGQKIISGVVIDSQIDPVPGVNILIKGTTIGSTTDSDGRFSITIDSASFNNMDTNNIKVVISFIGYKNLEIAAGREKLIAYLEEDVSQLSEVVVTARPQIKSKEPKKKYSIIRIFYGTDRLGKTEGGRTTFSGERGQVSYGSCDVSVPDDRPKGTIPEPSFIRLEFSRDPYRHFILKNTIPMSKSSLVARINERLATSPAKNALIFIHGYNVSFHDAALRTAQMAKDLNFDGVPIFYSWPSKSSFHSYAADESTIEWSEPYIKNFISDVANSTNAQNIYLIGHSMGTRGLTRALVSLIHDSPNLKNRIREVILAAPDIDVDIFKRDIVPRVTDSKLNLTLYASKNDLALKASMFFHTFNRAGQSGDGIIVVNGVETVDASNVESIDFFGHSYFSDTKEILRDIYLLVQKGQRAAQRTELRRKLLNETPYWILNPEYD